MKKRITAVAVALMCAAGSVNTVFASTFSDIKDVPWPGAAQYIDEAASLGLMSGYTENGKKLCKAKNPVTYCEAVQFMYSIMCEYDSANKADGTVIAKWTSAMQTAKLPSWIHPAVAYALENGILSTNDIKIFISSSGAQNNARREDVAVIFGKALAKIHEVNKSAVLTYADKANIASSSVPYVELLNRLNLMVGDDNNNFNPKVNINRAEMAVLSTKAYKSVKNIASTTLNEQVVGEVVDVTEESITVLVNDKERKIDVIKGASVLYNGEAAELLDINVTDNAIVVVSNGKAVLISASSVYGTNKNTLKKGMITNISETRITIEDGSKKSTYKFSDDLDDVSLKLDGSTTKDVEDLIKLVKDGKNIEAEISADKNSYVTRIIAVTQDNSLEGEISDIKSSKILIKSGSKTYTYNLLEDTDDTEVTIDGDEAEFDELKELFKDGTKITVKLTLNSDKEVKKITAATEASSTTVSGTIRDITSKLIEIRTSGGSTKEYAVDSKTTVTIDGATSTVSKLVSKFDDGKEYTAKVTVSGDKATKIAASLADSEELLNGRIVSIDDYEIKVRDADGKTHTVPFASSGCEFTIDDRVTSLSSVMNKYEDGSSASVKAYITTNSAGRAINVDIVTGTSTSTSLKEGTLKAIDDEEITITLSSGTKKTYTLAESCKVTIDGSSSSVSKLENKFDDDGKFEVTLTFNDDDEVSRIKAVSSLDKREGRLKMIDMDKITVTVDGVDRRYEFAGSVKLIVDGDDEVELERFVDYHAILYRYDVELTRNSNGNVTKIIATKVK